ncbi:MAG: hypothetical protein AB7S75_16395 [Desulfococcaceae bacterium]
MARLSDPESLMRKLNHLGEQIDAFYETADLAKQIKDRLLASRETAHHYEKQFEIRSAEMENLKSGYEKNLLNLQEIIRSSEDKLSHMLIALGYEKSEISGIVNELAAERNALRDQCRETESLLPALEKEITGRMAWLWKEQESVLEENRYLILRGLDENRLIAKKESEMLTLFSLQMQEETEYLSEQAVQWQEKAEKRLHKELHAFDALKVLYEKALGEITDTGRKYEAERAGLLDAFRREKQSLQAVAEKLICERRIFREELLILEKEKAGILKEITGQMAWLSEQSAGFFRDAQYRLAQHLDENRNLLLPERESLSQFAQEVQEEIFLQQAELESYKKRTKIRISRRIRDFDQVQSEYEKLFQRLGEFGAYCETELLRMLTDWGFEKQELRKTAQQLAGKYEEAVQRQQQIQRGNQQILQSVTGQISYLEQSVQESLAHIRLQAAQSLDENRIHIQNAWEELSNFSNEIREEIYHLENGLEKFTNCRAFELFRMAHALKMQTAHFRESAFEKIRQQIALETAQLQERSAQEFQNLHSAFEQEKAGLEHLIDQRINHDLSELAGTKEEIRHHAESFRQIWDQWAGFCREADTEIAGLRELRLCSDRELMEIRSDSAYEKMQIREQSRQLEQKYAEICHQQNKSEDILREYLREITERISYNSLELEKKFQENDCRIAQQMDEHRQRIEQEKSEFAFFSDQIQEEIMHLAGDLERFRNETLAHLNHRYRDLRRKHEKFLQSLREEFCSMFSEQSQHLHSAAEADRKETALSLNREKARLDEMLPVLNSYKEQFNTYTARLKEICEKSEEIEKKSDSTIRRMTETGDRAEDQLQKIITEFLEKQGQLHQALENIDREQSELRTHYQNFSQEAVLTGRNMTEQLLAFRENSETLLQEIHSRFAQEREECKTSVRENLAKEMDGHLNEKMTGFEQRIFSETDQKISALSEQQLQLRQYIAKEMEKCFSQIGKQESAGQEKEKLKAELSMPESEKTVIRQQHNAVSEELKRMDREMRHAASIIRQYTEKEVKRVSGELDIARKEIGDTKKHLGAFSEQIKEKLKQDSEKQIAQQADFRKKIIAALIARLGEDFRKLQDQDEINLRECKEEIRRSDKYLLENLENLEAGMAENLDRIKTEQEKIVPFVRKNISVLAERQKGQGEILKELGERIKTIEEYLKSRTRK